MFLFHIAKIMELYDNGIILCWRRMFFLYCNELPSIGLWRFFIANIYYFRTFVPHL